MALSTPVLSAQMLTVASSLTGVVAGQIAELYWNVMAKSLVEALRSEITLRIFLSGDAGTPGSVNGAPGSFPALDNLTYKDLAIEHLKKDGFKIDSTGKPTTTTHILAFSQFILQLKTLGEFKMSKVQVGAARPLPSVAVGTAATTTHKENPCSGTVAFIRGSKVVNGTNTEFITDLRVGYQIRSSRGNGAWYTVESITSPTVLNMTYEYQEDDASGSYVNRIPAGFTMDFSILLERILTNMRDRGLGNKGTFCEECKRFHKAIAQSLQIYLQKYGVTSKPVEGGTPSTPSSFAYGGTVGNFAY